MIQLVAFKNQFCDIESVSTKGDDMDKKALSKIILAMTLLTTPILAENDQDLSQTEPSYDNSASSSDNSNERDSADQKEKDRREITDLLGQSLMERGVY